MAEALIVAVRRNVGDEVASLIDGLGFDIVAVTPAAERRIALAYAQWGKGTNPAALNFGDCFAYAVAKENSCGLLYVGDDFSKTDIARYPGRLAPRVARSRVHALSRLKSAPSKMLIVRFVT